MRKQRMLNNGTAKHLTPEVELALREWLDQALEEKLPELEAEVAKKISETDEGAGHWIFPPSIRNPRKSFNPLAGP
jgi:hypothetical protein